MTRGCRLVLVAALMIVLPACAAREKTTGADVLQSAADGRPARFTKLDARGEALPEAAKNWAMVRDNRTGLFWEVKTVDDSVHNRDRVYTWKEAKKKFIAVLNGQRFGGFADWRLPGEEELQSLVVKDGDPGGPLIDTAYFPNTAAAEYWSFYICGDGSFVTRKVRFCPPPDEKKKAKKFRARAVRGEAKDL